MPCRIAVSTPLAGQTISTPPDDVRRQRTPSGEVTDFEIFPDSAGTIYLSDRDVDGRFRLYVADTRLFGDGFEDGMINAWPDVP